MNSSVSFKIIDLQLKIKHNKYTTPLGFQNNTQVQHQAPPQVSMHNPDYSNPIPNSNQFDNFEKIITMNNTTNQDFEKYGQVRITDTQEFKELFAAQNAANQFDALSPIHTRTNQQHYTGMQVTKRQQNRQSNFK